MTKLLKRLPDDNEKHQPLVGEISWGKNLILMAGGKDNQKREFYHAYRDLPKVQPLVAQIGWSHNLIIFQHCKDHLIRKLEDFTAETVMLAATIQKNFKEVGI
ncbi:MAG: hypothetical protein BA871_06560 [Desulfuromonadales bacterium C00003096]|jgi:hypothetical protein|nr:MAG: hypothetical protein BA871_06560 [Desulfuromonadales bacterium C00003096]